MAQAPRLSRLTTLLASIFLTGTVAKPAPVAAQPPALDLPTSIADSWHRTIRERFGHGPSFPMGPGPEVIPTPTFVWVSDVQRSLPGTPWSTANAYAEALELVRTAYSAVEPDRARVLIVFTTFNEGGRALFYTALANDTSGLGDADEATLFDNTPSSVLDGYAWMGSYEVLEEAGAEFASEAFLHELNHRWTAYLKVDLPGIPPNILLGRNDSHWSFLAETGNSPMEGNLWIEEADGWWRTGFTEPRSPRFSDLDLYLMGLLPPEEVSPVRVLRGITAIEPAWYSVLPESSPAHRLGISVRVRAQAAVEIDIEDIVSAAGPRVPAAVKPREPRVWPVGIALLSDGRAEPTPERLKSFALKLETWVADFERATRGLMRLDTRLAEAGLRPFGEPCSAPQNCDRTESDRCATPLGEDEPVCTRTCLDHRDCGTGACCVGQTAPGLCLSSFRACEAPPRAQGLDTMPSLGPDAGSMTNELGDPAGVGCGCDSARALSSRRRPLGLQGWLLVALALARGLRWRRVRAARPRRG